MARAGFPVNQSVEGMGLWGTVLRIVARFQFEGVPASASACDRVQSGVLWEGPILILFYSTCGQWFGFMGSTGFPWNISRELTGSVVEPVRG